MLKCNNCRKVAKKIGSNEKRVSDIKNGRRYGKYCNDLREEVNKKPKEPLIEIPEKEVLEDIINNNTYSYTAKYFNVSRPTIKRWMRYYDIEK